MELAETEKEALMAIAGLEPTGRWAFLAECDESRLKRLLALGFIRKGDGNETAYVVTESGRKAAVEFVRSTGRA